MSLKHSKTFLISMVIGLIGTSAAAVGILGIVMGLGGYPLFPQDVAVSFACAILGVMSVVAIVRSEGQ